jgi:hypothetical protein
MIDFINDDHKEMHGMLLRRGFTFEHDGKPTTGSAKWGFAYRNLELDLVIFCESSIYVRAVYISSGQVCDSLYGNSFDEITKYFTGKDTPVTIEGTTSEASLSDTPYAGTNKNCETIKEPTPVTYPNPWDTYAAAALNGLLSCGSLQTMDAAGDLAKFAAELADGLISERAKRNG